MVKAIVGACWGDEGKGKITDVLASDSDVTIRFQGGSNAGHTIKNHYGKFVLHQLPSGVFNPKNTNIIGNGVALNIDSLLNEIDYIVKNGAPDPKLLVSDRTQIVMPYHILFDEYEEEHLGNNSFGSTKSGIAPFYSDKYAKIGFQICELFDEASFLEKLGTVIEKKNIMLKHYYNKPLLDAQSIFKEIIVKRDKLSKYVGDMHEFLSKSLQNDENILLEGQLGALKDPDHGIYPMVTSSSTLAGFGSVGASIPPHKIKQIIAVVKSYSSTVGAGEFVSEIFGEEAEKLRQLGGDGGEFGATTGRPRRMGHFDVVASKYGCSVQGATEVAFTVLDVLSYMKNIPVCVAYDIDGKITTEFPNTPILKRAKPVIEMLPGFKCDISGITKYSDLPANARNYIEFVEKSIGVPITMISNGPSRDNIIYK